MAALPESALRRSVHERLLREMIGGVPGGAGIGGSAGKWKVLVLDATTTRILSSAVKMSDILEMGVSVVEDLHKDRQPLPLPAVYFLTPTSASVERLLADYGDDSEPQYSAAHVFFSSRLRGSLLEQIKGRAPLLSRLRTLKETNLEFEMVDSRTAITDVRTAGGADAPHPLMRFFGPGADAAQRDSELGVIAERLATLFATLKDFPAIRYYLPPPPSPGDAPGASGRSTLTQRLAAALHENLARMQQAGVLPGQDTCDLIILDRSYDPVAPVIHEWTYEAMVYDLLPISADSTYTYELESSSSRVESKETTIDERDSVWVELRHMFVADVYRHIAERFREFQTKNKAAQAAVSAGAGGARGGGEMSLGAIRGLITALPQYQALISQLSLHIQISGQLKTTTNKFMLAEVGEMEQDLVLGDKNSKHLMAFIKENIEQLAAEDVMRLYMAYVGTHPEKMDGDRRSEWQTAGRLTSEQMDAVMNLAFLGVKVSATDTMRSASSFFVGAKKGKKEEERPNQGLRVARSQEEDYSLYRFEPLLRGVLEAALSNRLSPGLYPYIRTAPAQPGETGPPGAGGATGHRRAGSLNWTRRDNWGGAGAAGAAAASAPARKLIVFILGGAARSEMRVVHEVAKQMGRDVLLASNSVDTPRSFVSMLQDIGSPAAAAL